MSITGKRLKTYIDASLEKIKKYGLSEAHGLQIPFSAIFGDHYKWIADSIQSKVRGTKVGAKKHIEEIETKIGFKNLLLSACDNVFIDFAFFKVSIVDKIVKIKDGWTRTTKVISLLIGTLFFVRKNEAKIIKLSSKSKYYKIEKFIVDLFYLGMNQSNERIFSFKNDSNKYKTKEQLDTIFVNILHNQLSFDDFKKLPKSKNQVHYFREQVLEYYYWINRNSKLMLNKDIISNVNKFVTNVLKTHIILLQESLESDETLDGTDFVDSNDKQQEFLADGIFEIVYVKAIRKYPILDNQKIKDVFDSYISDLEYELQTCGIATEPKNFYTWLQYSNLSNKITNKRKIDESFNKLMSDFIKQVNKSGEVDDSDFTKRLKTNLELNLTYMDDFKNIKKFIQDKKGLHQVFIPFILRIKRNDKWDKHIQRLFRMFSLLNRIVVRGNLWPKFSEIQKDIITDKDFDSDPSKSLIKHLVEKIDLAPILEKSTFSDEIKALKHLTIFDKFINHLLNGENTEAITLIDTVSLRVSKQPPENGEHVSPQNLKPKPILNVNKSGNIVYCDETLNKKLSNKPISEKKKIIESHNYNGISLKAILPLFGYNVIKDSGYDKNNIELMKKYFDDNYTPINTDEEWDKHIDSSYSQTKRMYREFYTQVFEVDNFKKLMKTGI